MKLIFALSPSPEFLNFKRGLSGVKSYQILFSMVWKNVILSGLFANPCSTVDWAIRREEGDIQTAIYCFNFST